MAAAAADASCIALDTMVFGASEAHLDLRSEAPGQCRPELVVQPEALMYSSDPILFHAGYQ